jgi:hypothetical protein
LLKDGRFVDGFDTRQDASLVAERYLQTMRG